MKKIFMIAGEPSGDLHGSYIIKELFAQQDDLVIKAWGGNKMKTAGAEILRTLDHLAFMGFAEVAKNFLLVLSNFRLCKKQIKAFEPDLIVFIDYPGFNLRMAKWAKSNGYKTIQYIAPAAWAWKENRVDTMRKYIDKLLVILPFEKAFFAKHSIDAHYVGHPLVEEIADWKLDPNFILPSHESSEVHIGLFPGSRMQEIKLILPQMIEYAQLKKDFQFYIAVPEHLDEKVYHAFIGEETNVHLIKGKNYDLLSSIDVAVVASGTATLEVALFDVPQVVVYKTNPISFTIAKQLVKTKYISLVNLICGREVIRELIQDDFNLVNLTNVTASLLYEKNRDAISKNYYEIKSSLTEERASLVACKVILNSLSSS